MATNQVTNEDTGTAIAGEVRDGLWLVSFPHFALRQSNRASFTCQQIDFAIAFDVSNELQSLAISQSGSATNVSICALFNGHKPRTSSIQRFQWNQKEPKLCSLQLVIEFLQLAAEGQQRILTHFLNLFENRTMTDVRFIVKDEEIGAHVALLVPCSPVMAAMLADDRFEECQTKEVRIEDMEPQVFREMLRYLYTGTVARFDDPHMAELLFAAADRFQIEALRALCVRKLLEQLTLENCIRYLVMAHLHSVPDLLEAAYKAIGSNQTKVWGRPDWKALGQNYFDLFFEASQRMVAPIAQGGPLDVQNENSQPEIAEIRTKLHSPPGAERRKQRCYDLVEEGKVHCCRFHPTEPKLACGMDGGRICLFSGASHSTPFDQWNKTIWKAATREWITCIDWKADGSKLAAGCSDGTVVVWEEDGTRSFETKEYSHWVHCIQWNKAENRSHLFVTGSEDTRAIAWDSDRKVALHIFRFHSSWIEDVVWISADQFASCSDDKTIKICRLGERNPLRTFAHQNSVRSMRWNEPDRRLASCSDDESIKIWSLDRDEPTVTLLSYGLPILCVDWHRRIGSQGATSVRWWIAGGCAGGVVLVWDLQLDGEAPEPRRLTGHSGYVVSVAFSPDGEILASADRRGNVLIWWTKKWETIFEVQTGKMLGWQKLSFDSSRNKLAIPNDSSEVFVVEFDD